MGDQHDMQETQKVLAMAAQRDLRACHEPSIPELDWRKIRPPTNGDLRLLVTEAIFKEHFIPAVQLETPEDFASFTQRSIDDFAMKRAAMVALSRAAADAQRPDAALKAVEADARAAGFTDLWEGISGSLTMIRRAKAAHERIEESDLADRVASQNHIAYHAHHLGWSWAYGCSLAVLAGDSPYLPGSLMPAFLSEIMERFAREAYIAYRRVEWDAGVPSADTIRWASARAAQRRFGNPDQGGPLGEGSRGG